MNLSKKKLRDLRDLSGEIVLASNGNGNGPPVSPWPLHLPTKRNPAASLQAWELPPEIRSHTQPLVYGVYM